MKTNFMKRLLKSLTIFCFFFIILCAFWKDPYLISDEEEIFVKGQQIANGLHLYREIGSQHMPLMYLMAAVISKLGVSTITGFRLGFYFILAITWTMIYMIYINHFDKKMILGGILIFFCTISSLEYGTCILSEQFQAQGMVILLLEMERFSKDLSLKFSNCFMISLAIFLSFGNAFVSIFSIFFCGLTILMMELRQCIVHKKNLIEILLYLIKKYWTLIVTVLFPWFLLIMYFSYTKTIRDFYSWAYLINRKIYPKYTIGYGSGILGGLFGGVTNIGKSIEQINMSSLGTIRGGAIVLLGTIALIDMYSKRCDKIKAIGMILFLIGTASRGVYNNPHGIPACAVLSMLTAIYVYNNIDKFKQIIHFNVVATLLLLLFIGGYLGKFGNVFSIKTERIAMDNIDAYQQRKLEDMIDRMTTDGERVGFSILNYDILLNAHVTPASVTGGSCPWLWEWGGAQAMKELSDNPPRLFLYKEDSATWGYPITEYAPDLGSFISTRYTRAYDSIGGISLYIRNDEYAEWYSTINGQYVYCAKDEQRIEDTIRCNQVLRQEFCAEISTNAEKILIPINCNETTESGTLEICVGNGDTQEILQSQVLKLEDIVKEGKIEIPLNPIKVEKGHHYFLQISLGQESINEQVGIYFDAGFVSNTSYSIINNKKRNNNLIMQIKTN